MQFVKEMPFVVAKGLKIYYLTRGEGSKNLIFIHGMHCTPHYWLRAMEALPPNEYRSFAIDRFGESDRPRGGYNVPSFTEQVVDFMDAMGLQKATLLGHSMGGIIAQLFAIKYKDRLDKLVLVATEAHVRGHGTVHKRIEQLRSPAGLRAGIISIMETLFYEKPSAEEFNFYLEHVLKARREDMEEAVRSTLEIDLVDQLKNIEAKTLIFHGTLDVGRKMEHAQGLNDGIRNSRLVLVESGHSIMVEKPEEFNRAFIDFLAEPS